MTDSHAMNKNTEQKPNEHTAWECFQHPHLPFEYKPAICGDCGRKLRRVQLA